MHSAAAVAKFDNLQFLSDTVPKTMTYKQYKENKASDNASKTATDQTKEDGTVTNGEEVVSRQKSIAHMMQGQVTTNGTTNGVLPPRNHSMAHSPIVDRTFQHEMNGHGRSDSATEDVEMHD